MKISIDRLGKVVTYIILFLSLFTYYGLSVLNLPSFFLYCLDFFLVVGLVLILVQRIKNGILQIEPTFHSIIFVAFLAYMVCSFARNISYTDWILSLRYYMRLFLTFYVTKEFLNKNDLKFMYKLWFVLLNLHLVLVIQQSMILSDRDNIGGIFGIEFGASNTLSHVFLLVSSIIFLALYMYKKIKLIWFMSVICECLLIAAISEHKFYFFELIAMLILMVLCNRNIIRNALLCVLLGGALYIALTIAAQLTPEFAKFYNEIFTTKGVEQYLQSGYGGRLDAVTRTNGFELITKEIFHNDLGKCILGAGYGSKMIATSKEYNVQFFSYAKLYFDGGIIGFIIFISFFAAVVREIFKFGIKKYTTSGIGLILVLFLVPLLFYDSMVVNSTLIYFVLAFSYIGTKEVA